MDDELNTKLMEAQTKAEITDIVNLFNADIKKKEILRAAKYDELLDKIADQVAMRVEQRPDQFTNTELLQYIKTLQESIANSFVDPIKDMPVIQVKNELNIAIGHSLSSTSKARVRDAIEAILKRTAVPDAVEINDYEIEEDDSNEVLQ